MMETMAAQSFELGLDALLVREEMGDGSVHRRAIYPETDISGESEALRTFAAESGFLDMRKPQAEQRAPTPDMIRAEAQRRIMAAMGVADLNSCIVKQLNANMRASELIETRLSRALTPEEEAEAAALKGLASLIKRIRAASNAIETLAPQDYTHDRHWVI